MSINSFSIPLDVPLTVSKTTSVEGISTRLGEFIVGPENALIASLPRQAVADDVTYNPVVLCGEAGSGKTALLHALVALRSARPHIRQVVVTTGSDFARALRRAVETGSASELRLQYQRCDLFALDGIDELERHVLAQQELASLLDTLCVRGRMAILTASKIPHGNSALSGALASRLFGGLLVTVRPPAASTRRRIFRQLATAHELPLSETQIDELVQATEMPTPLSFPELNRIVLQLKVMFELHQKAIDSEMIHSAAMQLDRGVQTSASIISAVAKYYRLRVRDVIGASRRKELSYARSIAMYLCRLLSGETLTAIGRRFRNRDHTTVLHAVRKVAQLVESDPTTRLAIAELRDKMKSRIEIQ